MPSSLRLIQREAQIQNEERSIININKRKKNLPETKPDDAWRGNHLCVIMILNHYSIQISENKTGDWELESWCEAQDSLYDYRISSGRNLQDSIVRILSFLIIVLKVSMWDHCRKYPSLIYIFLQWCWMSVPHKILKYVRMCIIIYILYSQQKECWIL